jgi:hypothetical protein
VNDVNRWESNNTLHTLSFQNEPLGTPFSPSIKVNQHSPQSGIDRFGNRFWTIPFLNSESEFSPIILIEYFDLTFECCRIKQPTKVFPNLPKWNIVCGEESFRRIMAFLDVRGISERKLKANFLLRKNSICGANLDVASILAYLVPQKSVAKNCSEERYLLEREMPFLF